MVKRYCFVCSAMLLLLIGCGRVSSEPTQTPGADVVTATTSTVVAPTSTGAAARAGQLPTAALAVTESVPLVTVLPTAAQTASSATEPTVSWEGEIRPVILSSNSFPRARSIAATLTENDNIYLALGMDSFIHVTRSLDGGLSFSDLVQVSLEQQAFVLPFERPAIVATAAGEVNVAWSSPELMGRIFQVRSLDGGLTFGDVQAVSESAARETVLPRLVLDEEKNPLLVWLADSTLQLAGSLNGGATFGPNQVLDPQVCECCHPQPIVLGDHLYVVYRNLEYAEDGDNIRDIYFVRSEDGGQSFDAETRISDAPWFVNACPVSGPAIVTDRDQLFVSWMDGRNDSQRTFSHTDIWLATSDDEGQTWSTNRRINQLTGIYHNLPSMAIDGSGALHIVWEAWEAEREVIYYARSRDGGLTFTLPVAIVDSSAGAGRRPGNSSLLVGGDGTLYLSWADSGGVHLLSWQNAE